MATIVGAVLYVEDHVRVARFYREVLGLALIESETGHSRLLGPGFELVVHAHSAKDRVAGNDTLPPKRRVEAALRMIYAVPDISACRSAAALHGGQIDRDPPGWAGADADLRLGHDPEGNVFQVQPQ
jgi:predicted enzyme related to lactoylglutathione lyase